MKLKLDNPYLINKLIFNISTNKNWIRFKLKAKIEDIIKSLFKAFLLNLILFIVNIVMIIVAEIEKFKKKSLLNK